MNVKTLYYILFFLPVYLFGQNQYIKEKHISVDIVTKRKGIQITENYKIAREVLKNHGSGIGETIYYSNFEELKAYNAYTLVKRAGKKDKIYPVTDFNHTSYTPDEVFMSDSKVVTFSYPRALKETECIVEYQKEITNPRFLTNFEINDRFKIGEFTFKITHPKTVNIGFEIENCDAYNLEFSKDTIEDIIEYNLKIQNVNPIQSISKLEAKHMIYPHIKVWIKSFTTSEGEQNIGNTYKDLYQWYVDLLSTRANEEANEIIKEKVDEITKPYSTQKEKLDAIYQWVQNSIEYLAFGDDMNGFIPRGANTIYDSRYGDCKDMSNMLRAMLNYAEIPSYLTWVGTRNRPFTYTEFPCIAVDNHLICTSIIDSEYYFLDATHNHLLSTEVRKDIQGKQALIGFDKDSCTVVNIPIESSDQNTKKDTVYFELSGERLKCKSKSKLSGYYRSDFFNYKNYVNYTDEKQVYLRSDSYNKNCHDVENIDWVDSNECIYLDMNYEVNNQVLKSKDKLFINFNTIDILNLLMAGELDKRSVYVEENFKFKRSIHSIFEIPKGYTVVNLKESKLYKNPQFSLSQNIRVEGRMLFIDYDIEIDFIKLAPEYFKTYSEFLNQVKNIQQYKIQFKKI